MSDDEKTPEASPTVADALGPPPKVVDTDRAAPSKVLETILLRFLARVIHADGEVHPQELGMLVEIAVKLKLEEDEAKRILEDELRRESDCAALAAQLPDEPRRREAYAMGCLMCIADGDVHENERRVLADFARGARIPTERAEAMFAKLEQVALEIKNKTRPTRQ